MSRAHVEWLSLVETSGPFLAVKVLDKTFPQGLESVATPVRQRLRIAYEEWRDAVDENDADLEALHRAWVDLVLSEILECERDDYLFPDGDSMTYRPIEHDGSYSANLAIAGDGRKPEILVSIQAPGTDLEKVAGRDGWPASIVERSVALCREKGVRFALVTDGERWTLVNAPTGATSSHVSWYARLWFQETVTLNAFRSLLGIRRVYAPENERLDAMFDESLQHHEEVTDTLGTQVRQAVEVLIQSLDKADQDRNRELLQDVAPGELYEAGLTVMMRLVFVLSAEERGLLLLCDPVYDQYYAVSTLRAQLSEEADRHGPEILERRYDAWSRLLAVFRAVYGGVEHESLRMPALGGSLFDPDRFAFLEGRTKGSSWREVAATPLPIDNRTVLLLLKALQILEQSGGALHLSYRALDVEQIGHVYEGLLEYTVKRMPEVVLGLEGSKKAKDPNLALEVLEEKSELGEDAVVEVLITSTGRSETALRNALQKEIDDAMRARIVVACGGDAELADRVVPFAHLLRTDAWGESVVYDAEAFAVTLGSDRSKTGTHYTPKSLTESVVQTTLEPVVYNGLAEGKPREEWELISTEAILDLKVCDPAMGSGAFLVQTCRWLAERLVEAWAVEEENGRNVTIDGDVVDELVDLELMPKALDDRLTIARRMIAERCLYGVDINPMAVELAKLSIWLVTLSKGRPFGFLDHNLKSGDSLLGIERIEQLTTFTMKPDAKAERSLFAQNVESAVNEAMDLRKRLRQIPIRDIHDVETMKLLDDEAREKISAIELVANAMIGEVLRTCGSETNMNVALASLSAEVGEYLGGNLIVGQNIQKNANDSLSIDLEQDHPPRRPFHWPLEFPLVFIENGGFDAVVGNPPFLGGQKLTSFYGTIYRDYLVQLIANGKRGSADLCAYFFLRNSSLLKPNGQIGLLATNTIAQGNTREVGLHQLEENGFEIPEAVSTMKWPGQANLEISLVWLRKGKWSGSYILDEKPVKGITSFLSPKGEITGDPYRLASNQDMAYKGSVILGDGFFVSDDEERNILVNEPQAINVIKEIINGIELNTFPNQKPKRKIISFQNWPLKRASKNDWDLLSDKERSELTKIGIVGPNYEGPLAADYPICLKKIHETVLPTREKNREKNAIAKRRAERWWLFGSYSHDLHKRVEGLQSVIAVPITSRTLQPSIIDTDYAFDQTLAVIASDNFALFGCIASTIHTEWTMLYGASMKADPRYIISDCFETYPFPKLTESLEKTGSQYYYLRQSIMSDLGIGVTKLYNRFHDPKDMSEEIQKLRLEHIKLDEAVFDAYDWEDLEKEYDFFLTKQGIRFGLSQENTHALMQRLLQLNHTRYQEEVEAGFWDKKKPKDKKSTTKKVDDGQRSLF